MHEIDKILEEKRAEERDQEDAEEEQIIQEKLPTQYHEFADVFSKKASDELPPFRRTKNRVELWGNGSPEDVVRYIAHCISNLVRSWKKYGNTSSTISQRDLLYQVRLHLHHPS